MRAKGTLLLLGGFTLACSGLEVTMDSGTAQAGPAESSVAPAFGDVAGWVGIAAVAGQRSEPLTPVTDRAQLVVPDVEVFRTATAGSSFTGWTLAGSVPLTFTGIAQVPYGCDDIPTEMALFSADSPLAEGLVWVTEPGVDVSVRPLDAEGTAETSARRWRSGELTLGLRMTDELSGRLELRQQQPLGAIEFQIQPMAGDSDPTPDLTDEHPVGVPMPAMVLRVGSANLLLTRTYSYEGVHIGVHRIGTTLEDLGGPYLYLCAF